MPDGTVHRNLYKAGWIIELPQLAYLATQSPTFAAGHFCGYVIHSICDNDWDIQGVSVSESTAVNKLPILGYFIFGISSIYGAIFRRFHRSFITHFPGISTIIRLYFLIGWEITLLYVYEIIEYQTWHFVFLFGLWLGTSQGDLIHYLADKFIKKDNKKYGAKTR